MKRRTDRKQNQEDWRAIPINRVFPVAISNLLMGCGIKTQGEFFDLGSLAVLQLQALTVTEATQALQTMRDRGHKLPHQPAGSPANTEAPALPPNSVPTEPTADQELLAPDVDQAATTYQSEPATDKLPEPAKPKHQPRLSTTAAADAAALAVMKADEEAASRRPLPQPDEPSSAPDQLDDEPTDEQSIFEKAPAALGLSPEITQALSNQYDLVGQMVLARRETVQAETDLNDSEMDEVAERLGQFGLAFKGQLAVLPKSVESKAILSSPEKTEKVKRRKNSIMPKPITERAISALRLAEPIKKRFKAAGVETIEQLIDMTAEELQEDIGLAEISVRSLQTKLGEHNLAFKGESVTKKNQDERRSPAKDQPPVATGETTGTPLSGSTLSPQLQKRLLKEHEIHSLEELAQEFPNMENLHKKTETAIRKALKAWGRKPPKSTHMPKAESRLALPAASLPIPVNGHNPMASLLAGAVEKLNLGNATVRRMKLVSEIDFSGQPFELTVGIRPLTPVIITSEE